MKTLRHLAELMQRLAFLPPWLSAFAGIFIGGFGAYVTFQSKLIDAQLAYRRIDKLELQVAEKERNLVAMQQQVRDAEAKLKATGEQLAAKLSELEKKEQALSVVEQQKNTADDELKAAKAQVAALGDQRRKLEAEKDAAGAEKRKLEAENAVLAEKVQAAETKVTAAANRISDLEQKAQTVRADIQRLEAERSRTTDRLLVSALINLPLVLLYDPALQDTARAMRDRAAEWGLTLRLCSSAPWTPTEIELKRHAIDDIGKLEHLNGDPVNITSLTDLVGTTVTFKDGRVENKVADALLRLVQGAKGAPGEQPAPGTVLKGAAMNHFEAVITLMPAK
jgi:hypothetical protein